MEKQSGQTQYAREKLRNEINNHVEEFLTKGGSIEYISQHTHKPQPIGTVWADELATELGH